MTVIDYKGYRIEVCSVGKGWRASIFSPGSTNPWPNSPVNLENAAWSRLLPRPSALSMRASVHASCKTLPGRESKPLGVNQFGVQEDNYHSHTGDGFPRCRSAR